MLLRRTLLALLATLPFSGLAAAAPQGPGVPALTFTEDELFTRIGVIDAGTGAPRAHGTVTMQRGYLMIVWADDGGTNGGFGFFDVSNPKSPKLFAQKYDAETVSLREAHGFAMSRRGARDVIVLQAIDGVQLWDVADVAAPKRIASLKLPGAVDSNYGPGIWWVSWQGRWLYVGGSSSGLYVVDALDVEHPVLADLGPMPNPVPIAQTGGFRIGPVFAMGNQLFVTSMDQKGVASLDIGDPRKPVLVASHKDDVPGMYAAALNGGRLYLAGLENDLWAIDVRTKGQLPLLGSVVTGGRGGYLTVQDGFLHAGASAHYVKVDARGDLAMAVVGTVSHTQAGHDDDFGTAIGNLALVGDDHGHGSFFTPHTTKPDTTPPEVTMVDPPDGAALQPLGSRVGLTFSDAIDLASLDAASVVVRPVGKPPLAGTLAYQAGLVGFTPDAPLAPDTTYEVVVPAGGVRDWSGNAAKSTFVSVFSTGTALVSDVVCTPAPLAPVVPGAPAVLSASAFATVLAGSFTWDFGDGSPKVATTDDAISHVYAAPGHYSVRLEVKVGATTTACPRLQTVHTPPTNGRPTSSGTIAIDRARDVAWVVSPDADVVTRVLLAGPSVDVEIPVGRRPRSVAVSPDGRAWVACEDDATVWSIDATQGASSAAIVRLPRASRPHGIALDPDGSAAYVALSGTGELAKVDVATSRVLGRLPLGPTPRAVAVSADGARVLVTRFVSPEGHGEVWDVDAARFELARVISLPMDPGPDTKSSGRGLPNYVGSVVIAPDGARAWVTAKKDDVERGLTRDGLPLTFESTVRTIVAQLDLSTGSEDVAARKDLNDRSMAAATVLSPLGDYAFVAVEGSNRIEILDAYDRQTLASLPGIGRAPDGVALDETRGRLLVTGYLSRDVIALDVATVLASTSFDVPPAVSVRTIAVEPLSPAVLLGKQIFHDAADPRMSQGGYISCASCHHDGDQDGRVWDFTDRGEGLRNTISLLGRRGMAQGRLHWSGNFDEVQDFEGDIRGAFGGSGFLRDEDWLAGTRRTPLGDPKAGLSPELDALAAYVASLASYPASPYRRDDGSLSDEARAGKQVFERAGCGGCHGGADFTNSAGGRRFDVGTITAASGKRLGGPLDGLDTPTLRGVWATAPYLHDGSAATLEDVLARNVDDRHGTTSGLDERERASLVAYVRSLDGTDDPDDVAPKRSTPAAVAARGELAGGCHAGPTPLGALGPLGVCALAPLALLLRRARRRR